MGLDYYPASSYATLPGVYEEMADAFRETYGRESGRTTCRASCASARGSAATATATRS